MRPTFGGFNTVVQGIYSNQIALDTVGHNITNQTTTGYSRQRVSLSTTRPLDLNAANGPMKLGTGVQVSSIERVRNPFIDQQIWRENSALGFSTTLVDMLGRIESMFPEPSDTSLQSSLDAFWSAMQTLGANASDAASRSTFRQSGVKLVESLQEAGRQLDSMVNDINETFTTKVNKVNEISKKIVALNKQISEFESLQSTPANDLRDSRDALVDELSTLAKVTVQEDAKHNYIVQMNGVVLANGTRTTELNTIVDYDTDLYQKYNMRTLGVQTNDQPPIKVNFTTGEIGGLIESRDSDTNGVKGYRDMLDTMAKTLLCDFNQVHKEGYGLDNSTGTNFFGRDKIQYADITSLGTEPKVNSYNNSNYSLPGLTFKSYTSTNARNIRLTVNKVDGTPPRPSEFLFSMNNGKDVAVSLDSSNIKMTYDAKNGSYRITGKYGDQDVDLSFKLDTNSSKTSVSPDPLTNTTGDTYELNFEQTIVKGNSGVTTNWLKELQVNDALFDPYTGLDKIAAKTLASNIEIVYTSANRQNMQVNNTTKPKKDQDIIVSEGKNRPLTSIPQAKVAAGSYYDGGGSGKFSLEVTEVKDGKPVAFKMTVDGVVKNIPNSEIGVGMDVNGNIRIQDKTVSPPIYDFTLNMNYGTDGKLTSAIGDRYSFVLPKTPAVTSNNAQNLNIPPASFFPTENYQGPVGGSMKLTVLEVDAKTGRPSKFSLQMANNSPQTIPNDDVTVTDDGKGNYKITGKVNGSDYVNFGIKIDNTVAGTSSMIGDEYTINIPVGDNTIITSAPPTNTKIPPASFVPTAQYAGPASGSISLQVMEVDPVTKRATKFAMKIGDTAVAIPNDNISVTKDSNGNLQIKGQYKENGQDKDLNFSLKLDGNTALQNEIGDKYIINIPQIGTTSYSSNIPPSNTVKNPISASAPNMTLDPNSTYPGLGRGEVSLKVVETAGTPPRPTKFAVTFPGQSEVTVPNATMDVKVDPVTGKIKITGKDAAGSNVNIGVSFDPGADRTSNVGDTYKIASNYDSAKISSGNPTSPNLSLGEQSSYSGNGMGNISLKVTATGGTPARPTEFELTLPGQAPFTVPNTSPAVNMYNDGNGNLRIEGKDPSGKPLLLNVQLDTDQAKPSTIGDTYTIDTRVPGIEVIAGSSYSGIGSGNIKMEVLETDSNIPTRPSKIKLTLPGQAGIEIPNSQISLGIDTFGNLKIKGTDPNGNKLDLNVKVDGNLDKMSKVGDVYNLNINQTATTVTTVVPNANLPSASYTPNADYAGPAGGDLQLNVSKVDPATNRPSEFTVSFGNTVLKIPSAGLNVAINPVTGQYDFSGSYGSPAQPLKFSVTLDPALAKTSQVGDLYTVKIPNPPVTKTPATAADAVVTKGKTYVGPENTLTVNVTGVTGTPPRPNQLTINGTTIPSSDISYDPATGQMRIQSTVAGNPIDLTMTISGGNSAVGDSYTVDMTKTGVSVATNAGVQPNIVLRPNTNLQVPSGKIDLVVTEVDPDTKRPTKFQLTLPNQGSVTIPNDKIKILFDPVGSIRIMGKDGKDRPLDFTVDMEQDLAKESNIGDKYSLTFDQATIDNTGITANSPNMGFVTTDKFSGLGSSIELEVVDILPSTGRPVSFKMTIDGQVQTIPNESMRLAFDKTSGKLRIYGRYANGQDMDITVQLDTDPGKANVAGDKYKINMPTGATGAATNPVNPDVPTGKLQNGSYYDGSGTGDVKLQVLTVDPATKRPTKYAVFVDGKQLPEDSYSMSIDKDGNVKIASLKGDAFSFTVNLDTTANKTSMVGDEYTFKLNKVAVEVDNARAKPAVPDATVLPGSYYKGPQKLNGIEVLEVDNATPANPAKVALLLSDGSRVEVPSSTYSFRVNTDGSIHIEDIPQTNVNIDMSINRGVLGNLSTSIGDKYSFTLQQTPTVGASNITNPDIPSGDLLDGAYYKGIGVGDFILNVREVDTTATPPYPTKFDLSINGVVQSIPNDNISVTYDNANNTHRIQSKDGSIDFTLKLDNTPGKVSKPLDTYRFQLTGVNVTKSNVNTNAVNSIGRDSNAPVPKGTIMPGTNYTGLGNGQISVEVLKVSTDKPAVPTKLKLNVDGTDYEVPSDKYSLQRNADGSLTIIHTPAAPALSELTLNLGLNRGAGNDLNSNIGDKYSFSLKPTVSTGSTAVPPNPTVPASALTAGAYYRGSGSGNFTVKVTGVDAAAPPRPNALEVYLDGKLVNAADYTITAAGGKYKVTSNVPGDYEFELDLTGSAASSAIGDEYRVSLGVTETKSKVDSAYDNADVPNAKVTDGHYQGNKAGDFRLEVTKVDLNGKPTGFALYLNGEKVSDSDVNIKFDAQSGQVKVIGSNYAFDAKIDYSGGKVSAVGDNYNFVIKPSAKIDSMTYNSPESRDFTVELARQMHVKEFNLANPQDFKFTVGTITPEVPAQPGPYQAGSFDLTFSPGPGFPDRTITGTIKDGVASILVQQQTTPPALPPAAPTYDYQFELNVMADTLTSGDVLEFTVNNKQAGQNINQYVAKYTVDNGINYVDVKTGSVEGGTDAEDKVRLQGDNFDIVLDVPTDQQKVGDIYKFDVGAKTDVISLLDPLGYKYAGKVNTTYEMTVLEADADGKATKVAYSMDGGITQKTASIDSNGNIRLNGDIPFSYDITLTVNKPVKAGDNFVFEAKPDAGGKAELINKTIIEYDSTQTSEVQLKVTKLADEKGGIEEVEYTIDGKNWRRATVAYDPVTGKSTLMLDSTDNLADGTTPPSGFNYKIEMQIDAHTANNKGDIYSFKIPQGNGAGDNALRMAQFMKVGAKDPSVSKDSKHLGSDDYQAVLNNKSISSFYEGQIGVLGIQRENAMATTDNTGKLLNQMEGWRLSVSGVNIDEELTLMIQFQKGYNASARMMTTLDEMLDKLINGTGVVGR